ncbi:MAG: ferredoxin family protein, partial [Planctomycetes bacterium]|nr:ferredoxin family protein [Planctomycetota bacterium]
MAGKKVTVVIAQAPGRNPAKRQLEENIAAALLLDPDVEISLVPHINDLTPDHTGMLFLKSVRGDMVLLSWLFPRAARWILDRHGVKGRAGVSLIKSTQDDADDEDVAETDSAETEAEARPNALGAWDVPNRKIYCLDLRDSSDPDVFLQ